MKVIQICGTNGTGKTTLVKNLLRCGRFMKMNVFMNGKSREWWFDGRVAVIGKYNGRNCGGVDAGDYSGDALQHVIEYLLANYKPHVLLFEDVRYGGSYAFKKRVEKVASENGYEYVVLALFASFECICKRVLNRSGKENANYDAMRGKGMQVIRSCRKIANEGVNVVWCDTETSNQQKVFDALKGVINGS